MTPPRPVEEVARAIYEKRQGHGCTPWSRQNSDMRTAYRGDAIAAITRLRELGSFNTETLAQIDAEGQYEATRPSRYVFPAEEGK
jgi:hypothetical protein